MNYIITAAGLGSRFLKNGIKPPKPLIKVHGTELILWSLKSFSLTKKDKLFIVTLKRDLVKKRLKKKIELIYSSLEIRWLELEDVKNGQLLTLVEAIQFFNIKGSFIIHNCDTSYEPINYSPKELDNIDYFGLIPYFKMDGDNWSFLKLDENNQVLEVKEKKRISDNCSVGTYVFNSAEMFNSLIDKYLDYKKCRKDEELYIAPLYDFAIKNSLKVLGKICENVKVFGNPSELLETFKISHFELLSENDFNGHQRKTLIFDVDGTISLAPSNGDYSNCLPIEEMCKKIRFEHSQGTYIILFTSRNMRSFNGNIGLINKYTSQILINWLFKNHIPFVEIYFGKPWGEGGMNYIDDKFLSIGNYLNS